MRNYLLTSPLQDSWRLTAKNYVLNYNALNDFKAKNHQHEFIFFEPYGTDIETKKKKGGIYR